MAFEGVEKEISRRQAIGLLAAAGAGVMLGCGGGAKTVTTTTTSTSSTGTSSTSCTVTPEGEEGPYFVDDSATGFDRTDIRSNLDGSNIQSGIPFTLSIYTYDSENSCAAMANVQVDIWHCNASGIYSAEDVEDTSGETWLRGYQITDANGLATFKTIIPGWYAGRTTHIHLRLRSTYDSTTTGGTNTTQLFFPQDVVDTINTTISPYSAEGTNPTTNASDHVYSGETDGANLLTLGGDNTNGYTATIKINLPITALYGDGKLSSRRRLRAGSDERRMRPAG
jgi:protocatechuate 3,4-dioxygenase beta subunit